MEFKTWEEFNVNEFINMRDNFIRADQEVKRLQTECKNLNEVITFLRDLFKAEIVDGQFDLKISDNINADTPQGKFYRDALMGLFGPNQVPLNPVEPAPAEEVSEN